MFWEHDVRKVARSIDKIVAEWRKEAATEWQSDRPVWSVEVPTAMVGAVISGIESPGGWMLANMSTHTVITPKMSIGDHKSACYALLLFRRQPAQNQP